MDKSRTIQRAGGPRLARALARALAAEALGTALLLATVIGSGVMGERLCGGNVAIALLVNSLATGASLVALIAAFAPISGAHFNPLVSCNAAVRGTLPWRRVPVYGLAQIAGAFAGVVAAHVMFGEPIFAASTHARAAPGQWLAEFVATFGLLAVVNGCASRGGGNVAYAVAGFITAAYWFTSSTSFANPAVTLARAASDTFAGIRPADVPAFLVSQLLGAAAASAAFLWLVPLHRNTSEPTPAGPSTGVTDE